MKRYTLSTLVCMLITVLCIPSYSEATPKTPEPGAKQEEFQKLKNPVPFTKKSISRGKMWFLRECSACHGPDGKALIDVVADATNLTNTKMWYSGSTQGEIFRSIRDGAGEAMPPYKSKIKKEDDLWHLVNFIQSLWPKSQQPKLVEDKPKEVSSANSRES